MVGRFGPILSRNRRLHDLRSDLEQLPRLNDQGNLPLLAFPIVYGLRVRTDRRMHLGGVAEEGLQGRDTYIVTVAVTGHRPEMAAQHADCPRPRLFQGHSRRPQSPLFCAEHVLGRRWQQEDRPCTPDPAISGRRLRRKVETRGDVTETHRLWRHPSNPQRIGSGVLIGEHAFLINEPSLQVVEWKTGKTVSTQRLPSTTWGSLVHAGDRLYIATKSGETLVLSAGRLGRKFFCLFVFLTMFVKICKILKLFHFLHPVIKYL